MKDLKTLIFDYKNEGYFRKNIREILRNLYF